MRIVNHTPHPLLVRTRAGNLLEIERGLYVGVRVHHCKLGEHVAVETERGALVELAVREARWGGVPDLPAPEPGVIRVVTTHVAELAVLAGRPCHDLYVALQSYPAPDGRGRVYKALCPAAGASPALRALEGLRARHAPEVADETCD